MDRSEDGRRTLGWRSGAGRDGRDGRTGRTDGWVGRRSTMNGSLTRMPERAISRSVPSLSSSASWLLGAFRVRADSLRTELNSELTFVPRCLSESTQPYSLPDVDPAPPARTPPTSLTNNLVKYCTIEPWPGTLCVLPGVRSRARSTYVLHGHGVHCRRPGRRLRVRALSGLRMASLGHGLLAIACDGPGEIRMGTGTGFLGGILF